MAIVFALASWGLFAWAFVRQFSQPTRFHSESEGQFYENILLHMAAGVLAWIAISFYLRGRKLSSPRAWQVLHETDAAPVLLLRRFMDDALLVGKERNWLFGQLPVTLEQVLEKAFRPFGPIVAIGKPGELLAELGAARAYVGDNEWQVEVRRLLGACQRVVVLLGEFREGAGLAWEIVTIRKLGLLDKVILVVPPYAEAVVKERWEQTRPLFRGALPAFQGGELTASFDGDGRWLVHRVRKTLLSGYVRRPEDYSRSIPLQLLAEPLPLGSSPVVVFFLFLAWGVCLGALGWLAFRILG